MSENTGKGRKPDMRWKNGIYFIVRDGRKQAFHDAVERDGRSMTDVLNDAIDRYLGFDHDGSE